MPNIDIHVAAMDIWPCMNISGRSLRCKYQHVPMYTVSIAGTDHPLGLYLNCTYMLCHKEQLQVLFHNGSPLTWLQSDATWLPFVDNRNQGSMKVDCHPYTISY